MILTKIMLYYLNYLTSFDSLLSTFLLDYNTKVATSLYIIFKNQDKI